MQIKNKKNIFTYLFFIIFALITNAYCEEFNITAKEIIINKDSNILTGTGSVQAVDSEGKTIEADKIIYDKTKEFLTAEGNVKISDVEKNVIESDKITITRGLKMFDIKNNDIGEIRSAAFSPKFKKIVGISMIKKKYWNSKEKFKVNINGKDHFGTTCKLPIE